MQPAGCTLGLMPSFVPILAQVRSARRMPRAWQRGAVASGSVGALAQPRRHRCRRAAQVLQQQQQQHGRDTPTSSADEAPLLRKAVLKSPL